MTAPERLWECEECSKMIDGGIECDGCSMFMCETCSGEHECDDTEETVAAALELIE